MYIYGFYISSACRSVLGVEQATRGGRGNGISVNNDEHSQINHEDPGQLTEGVGEGGHFLNIWVFYAVNKYLIGELNLRGMNKASFKKLFSRIITARQVNYKNVMKLHIQYIINKNHQIILISLYKF